MIEMLFTGLGIQWHEIKVWLLLRLSPGKEIEALNLDLEEWLHISEEAQRGLDALTMAMAGAKVSVVPEPRQPQYEAMLLAPADWTGGSEANRE